MRRILLLLPLLASHVWAAGTLHVLQAFGAGSLRQGSDLYAGLIRDAAGNLYGAAESGGIYGAGVIYELSPGVGGWTETILYNFKGGANDGASPHATLTADAAGNLYGTTVAGGPHTSACGEGCGTVFMLSPAPGGYEETVLFRFNGADGAVPYAGVTLDSAGNLYGATISGGSFNAGVVYKLAATSGTWQQTLLYTFEGRPDGAAPYGTPILDATGNLYGTTEAGGARNVGIVYMLAPQADGSWTEQTLHTFAGGADGASPLIAGIIFDPQGNLYGTTTLGGTANCGTAFKLVRKISGGWTERILHNFLGVSSQDGENPNGVVFAAQVAISTARPPEEVFIIRARFSR